jgi:hypothetical protein
MIVNRDEEGYRSRRSGLNETECRTRLIQIDNQILQLEREKRPVFSRMSKRFLWGGYEVLEGDF